MTNTGSRTTRPRERASVALRRIRMVVVALVGGGGFNNSIGPTLPGAAALTTPQTENSYASSSCCCLPEQQQQQQQQGQQQSQAPQPQPYKRVSFSSFHADAWQKLTPQWWEDPRRADVRIEWGIRDDCSVVAERYLELLQEQLPAGSLRQSPSSSSSSSSDNNNNNNKMQLQADLTESLTQFTNYCRQEYASTSRKTASPTRLSSRLVIGRGPTSAKCPQWHVDHVPFRWIQTLVGPGSLICNYNNDDNEEEMDALLSMDDDDDDDDTTTTSKLHRHIESLLQLDASSSSSPPLASQKRRVWQVPTGAAVLLYGQHPQSARPCVHKSPDRVPAWQGRILLTMDVVLPSSVDHFETQCECD